MKKSIITISTLIILASIAGGFWYTKNQKSTTKPVDVIKEVQEEAGEDVILTETGIQDEDETISEGNQDSEELKAKPTFGIDDSGLKYNKDGSVDTSYWKEYRVGAVNFKYPDDWHEVELGVTNSSVSSVNYGELFNNQIKITIYGMPIDVNEIGEGWEKMFKKVKQQEINDFKKDSYDCKEKSISNNGLIMTCLEEKSNKLIKKYRKINKIKQHSWDIFDIFIEVENKKVLEANKKNIDEIINSLFIFNIKYLE